MSEWRKGKGEKKGLNWTLRRAQRGIRDVVFDTNYWKTFFNARCLVAPSDPSSLTFFGKKPEIHRMFFDQLMSEFYVRTEARGRVVDEWKLRPGRDNHWLDGVIGCMVAASTLGSNVLLAGNPMGPQQRANIRREKVSFRDLQKTKTAK